MRLVTARRYRRALCHDANVLLFQTAAGIIMYHFISDSARFCTFSLSFCCRHGYKFERFVRPPSQFFVRCTMQVMQFPLANKKVTAQTLDGQEKRWAINGWFRWTPFLILVKLNYDTWTITSTRWNIPPCQRKFVHVTSVVWFPREGTTPKRSKPKAHHRSAVRTLKVMVVMLCATVVESTFMSPIEKYWLMYQTCMFAAQRCRQRWSDEQRLR